MTVLDIWTGLAFVLVVEGLLYALFPSAMKQALAQMLTLPPDIIRYVGLLIASLGVAALWLLRG